MNPPPHPPRSLDDARRSRGGAVAGVDLRPPQRPTETRTEAPAETPTTPAQRRLGVALLLLTAFCFGLGQTVVFTVLPPYRAAADLSEFQVTLIFGCSAVFWVLASPRWGRRSDRVGRRPIVLLGLGGFVLGMVLFAGAIGVALSGALTGWAAFAVLALARSLHGGVASGGPAASQAYIADRSSSGDRQSALAGYAAAFGTGTVVGPSIGGLSAVAGPMVPLLIVAATGILSALLIWRFVPEATPPQAREGRRALGPLDPRLRTTLAFGLLSGIVTATQLQFVGFYTIDTLALSEAEGAAAVGFVLTAAAVASLAAQLLIVRVLRFPPKRLMRIAPLLVIAGFGGIVAGGSVAMIALGATISGLGLGMSYPAFNADASLRVGTGEQGGAAGLAAAAGASGFVLVPFIGSAAYGAALPGPFLLGIGAALVMAGLAWFRRA